MRDCLHQNYVFNWCQSAQAAITKYYKLDGSNNTVLNATKSEIKAPANLVLGEGILSGL